MAFLQRGSRRPFRLKLGLAAAVALATVAAAETVTLKNGIVYKGLVEKDNTIVSIEDLDGLKRVILRDSKIASTQADEGTPKVEHFAIVQPMTVHAGEMPKAAYAIKAGPWDANGRRSFRYKGPTGKLHEMTQGIRDLGPRVCQIRGVDGFWTGQVSTVTIPRPIVLGILAKVDQKNLEQRIKVCRFLIQAEWHAEARVEVERVAKDFGSDADVAEKMKNARDTIRDSEGRALLAEIDARRKAQQPRAVRSKLRAFPTEGMPADVVASVKDQVRKNDTRDAADRALAAAVKKAAEAAKIEDKEKPRIVAMLDALAEAPEALRERFEGFEKGQAEGAKPDELFALALSGFLAGSEAATTDLKAAIAMARAQDLAAAYLGSAEADGSDRTAALSAIRSLDVGGTPITLALLIEIVRRMPPPLRLAQEVVPGKISLLRVRDEPNPDQPSEYAILLPPEYSPRRQYPMVVALPGEDLPAAAVAFWADQASRRGYIVISPEYNLRNQPRDYRYTPSEHAAIVLSIRDALKRFAVDPDRVFLGGSLTGGNAAWDFGQGHPDLFAGVAVVSGLPAKYVWATRPNLARLPYYIVEGDLAPAETEVVFGEFARPLISKNQDITYVEYYRRGLEDLPEEAPSIFDWMAPRRRDPAPRTFEVVACRECDNRFYGIIISEFAAGRAKDPAAVDIQGKNLDPATITAKVSAPPANLLNLTTKGAAALDVWINPKLIDMTKKMEVRVNNKTVYRAMPKPDVETYLEDVRARGDRVQVYTMKVSGKLGAKN
jgi:pimeloyl-ACP methyl ester carboxylesterase